MTKYKSVSKKLPQRFLQQALLKYLRQKPNKGYTPKLLVQKLDIKNSKDSVEAALYTLVEKNKVIIDSSGRFSINLDNPHQKISKKATTHQGRADVISTGAAFVTIKGQSRDVYIPERYLNGALHQDIVELELTPLPFGKRPEGKVIKVISRNRTAFIGTLHIHKHYGIVYVSDGKISLEVKVKPEYYNEAIDQDVVIVEIYDFGEKSKGKLMGKVLSVINQEDRNDFEMNSILVQNGFGLVFPPEVLKETSILSRDVTEQDVSERRDLRAKNIFTIDPFDAKDFDDALSYEVNQDGTVEVGIHIADVTHFVKENSALDKEAYHRSTSVYLVDRVCPMLPERISNDLCSLRPNEDRFSFSAIFKFNSERQIVDQWFGKTLIHSKRRFTYEEAQEIIEHREGDYGEELMKLNELAKHLRKKRFEEGSIDFDSDEVKFILDENQKPIGIKRKERKDSHKLVEEFMLLANKKVAKFIAKKSKNTIPFIYRSHDLPDPERLVELALLAGEFGIKLNMDTPRNIAESLNRLTSDAANEDVLSVLRPMAIRCMAKAVYSTERIGHYGLGFEYYTHFTSPIRRYSDVLAHRILQENLTKEYRVREDLLEEKCIYISGRERSAINAERESIKYKQTEYLYDHVGEERDGVIRSMIDRGIFVELVESQADGMIRFDRFEESFSLHPARIKATGNKSGVVYRIGDRVRVKIEEVDMEKKQIEFSVVEKK